MAPDKKFHVTFLHSTYIKQLKAVTTFSLLANVNYISVFHKYLLRYMFTLYIPNLLQIKKLWQCYTI